MVLFGLAGIVLCVCDVITGYVCNSEGDPAAVLCLQSFEGAEKQWLSVEIETFPIAKNYQRPEVMSAI